MKKNIKILLSFILIITVLFINGKVFAADKAKVKIAANKTTLNVGDIVELQIKIYDITSVMGMVSLVGELDYDQNIFELQEITDKEILEASGLDELKQEAGMSTLKLAYHADDGWDLACGEIDEDEIASIIAGENMGIPTTEDGTIGTIKLKVKKASSTTADITLKELTLMDAGDGLNEISEELTVNLKINGNGNSGNGNSTSKQNVNKVSGEQGGGTTSNKNVYEGANATNETAPYTGVEEVVPIILILAIISCVTLTKIIKYKDI